MRARRPASPAGPTLDDLLAEAAAVGLDRHQVLLAARHYARVQALDELTPAQTADLLARLRERYAAPALSGDGHGDSASTAPPEVRVPRRRRAS